eukprot:452199-Amphidinium_carterae.1
MIDRDSSPSCATRVEECDFSLEQPSSGMRVKCQAVNSRTADFFLELQDDLVEVRWLGKSIATKKHLAQARVNILVAGENALVHDLLFVSAASDIRYSISKPLVARKKRTRQPRWVEEMEEELIHSEMHIKQDYPFTGDFIAEKQMIQVPLDFTKCGGAVLLVLPGFVTAQIPDGITLGDWLSELSLPETTVLWAGCALHPDMFFNSLRVGMLDVTVAPNLLLDKETPMIRPLDRCRATKIWSLAEFQFWHQGFQPTAPLVQFLGSDDYGGPNDLEVLRSNVFLEETLQRIEYAKSLMAVWNRRKRDTTTLAQQPGVKRAKIAAEPQVTPAVENACIPSTPLSSLGRHQSGAHDTLPVLVSHCPQLEQLAPLYLSSPTAMCLPAILKRRLERQWSPDRGFPG